MKKDCSVQSVKLEITISNNSKNIISELKKIQELTRKACNEAITYFYNFNRTNEFLVEKFNEIVKSKDLYGVELGSHIERNMKKIMNTINTKNVAQTRQFVQNRFNNDIKKVLNGEQSLSTFKSCIPIFIHSRNYLLKEIENNYKIAISLFNKQYIKESGIDNVLFKIERVNNYQKFIIERIAVGQEYNLNIEKINSKIKRDEKKQINTKELEIELSKLIKEKEYLIENGQAYEYGSAQISEDKKGKWYVSISYYVPKKNKVIGLNRNKILGIDLGVVNTLTYQIYDSDTKEYVRFNKDHNIIDSGEITAYLNKLNMRKASIISSKKLPGDGRVGHGRSALYKPLTDIGNKHARYMDTYNHKLSKKVIEIAKKHGCGVIQIENLSGIKKNKKKFLRAILKDWSYYDLQTKIKYKAELEGIEVKEIKPFYTSQRCSKCGHIHKESRKNQAVFSCINCGHTENADTNASKNIAIPNIDLIIEEYISSLKKSERNPISVMPIENSERAVI